MPAWSARRIATQVEDWFARNQRPLPWRGKYDPYRIWISEVMAQQTRLDVVVGYFRSFTARFPDVRSLASSTDDEVTAAWSGLGYYKRARMLRAGAENIVRDRDGLLPATVPELLAIKGIGRYTAGAIASIAFDQRVPIVDGNIARLLARFRGIEHPLKSAALMRDAWREAETLVAASTSPRDFNQGLMEIGALICRPRHPICDSCPLRGDCVALRAGRTEDLPRKAVAKAPRSMRIALYIIRDRRGRILLQRERGRLMRDLYRLPEGSGGLFGADRVAVHSARYVGTFRHTVTTRRIQYRVYAADLVSTRRPKDSTWIRPQDIDTLPHPSWVRKALHLLP